ncbi:MAG: D-glycerate dehydrogenase [Candidatus Bipolaricaulota bacterium]|nr:D-glycerate dehydrogenase [Candidatus Bipolaricaulota bacterium]MDW8126194.1 D-glycerate dehydrogenase [Candidatus Bipolaricaulota bacterium]
MSKVAIMTKFFPEEVARLCAAGHLVTVHEEGGDKAAVVKYASDAEALVIPLSLRIDVDTIARLAALKIIANLGVGVDNIDVAAATRRKILVTNTPDVLTEATADLAWALLLAVARRIVEADQDLRREGFLGWTFISKHLGVDVYGKTMGIIGFGRIGQAIARRAKGFGMTVLYHARTPKPEVEEELGARFTPLAELLSASDFVVLCVPLTSDTRHLIGERELSFMKRDAILVNIARGPVVDEEALARALKEGRILGAGLDVFEHEPQVHPDLLLLPNVVLTPHIGSATWTTRRRMAALAVDNVLAFFRGERPPTLVNPEAWLM